MGSSPNGGVPLLPKPGQPAPLRSDEFAGSAVPNFASFALSGVGPPSTLYIQRDDVLVIQAATSTTNEVVTVSGRMLLAPMPRGGQPDTPKGGLPVTDARNANVIEPFTVTLAPASNRTVVTKQVVLAEGYLLSMASLATVAATRGQTFVRATLVRGAGNAPQPSQVLFADYVTTAFGAAFPNGRAVSPVEGPGFVRTFLAANPPAGADWTITIPSNARWKIRAWSALLTASATVANRQVVLTAGGGGGNGFLAPALTNVTAGQAATFSAAPLSTYTGVLPLFQILPLPGDLFLSGATGILQSFGVSTTGLQVGDQWSNISVVIEEWLDNV